MFAPRFYTAPHFAAHQQPRHHRQEQQPNFQGLFRMLDDWERYAQQGQGQGRRQCQQQQAQTPSFTPKFDVKETETTYELHGEFPGMDKENVHIEFTDPQTLQIRGHIERSLTTAGTPPATNLISKNNDEDVEMSNGVVLDAPAPAVAATEQQQPQHEETDIDEDDEPVVIDSHEHDDAASVTSSNKSFQATVEDEVEEGTATIATPATTNAEAIPTKPTTTEEKKPVVEKKQPQKPAAAPTANINKYWLRERSIGRFARSFTFTSRVDTEGVSASMHNGVLSVTVPKARKHESYRIAIL